jgi:hypothetical protein
MLFRLTTNTIEIDEVTRGEIRWHNQLLWTAQIFEFTGAYWEYVGALFEYADYDELKRHLYRWYDEEPHRFNDWLDDLPPAPQINQPKQASLWDRPDDDDDMFRDIPF